MFQRFCNTAFIAHNNENCQAHICCFLVRFAISGKDEDWQEALSGSKSKVNVISVTSAKRKGGNPAEEQTKSHKKQKKFKHKHKTG